jgi:hypothetical protein
MSILTSCQPQASGRFCLPLLAALAARQSRVAKLWVEGCQNLSWGCQNRGRRLPNRHPGLPFGSQGCQEPSREWQPARPALNADLAFEAVFHLFLFLRTALEGLARADAIELPVTGRRDSPLQLQAQDKGQVREENGDNRASCGSHARQVLGQAGGQLQLEQHLQLRPP